jgi:hypothetical protein
MKWLRRKIPFLLVRRWRYDEIILENYTLRDALREVNEELRKHRRLVGRLSVGDPETTAAFERACR